VSLSANLGIRRSAKAPDEWYSAAMACELEEMATIAGGATSVED
jgi:hypothetical protein